MDDDDNEAVMVAVRSVLCEFAYISTLRCLPLQHVTITTV